MVDRGEGGDPLDYGAREEEEIPRPAPRAAGADVEATVLELDEPVTR
jgi:hypothetical protein